MPVHFPGGCGIHPPVAPGSKKQGDAPPAAFMTQFTRIIYFLIITDLGEAPNSDDSSRNSVFSGCQD